MHDAACGLPTAGAKITRDVAGHAVEAIAIEKAEGMMLGSLIKIPMPDLLAGGGFERPLLELDFRRVAVLADGERRAQNGLRLLSPLDDGEAFLGKLLAQGSAELYGICRAAEVSNIYLAYRAGFVFRLSDGRPGSRKTEAR